MGGGATTLQPVQPADVWTQRTSITVVSHPHTVQKSRLSRSKSGEYTPKMSPAAGLALNHRARQTVRLGSLRPRGRKHSHKQQDGSQIPPG